MIRNSFLLQLADDRLTAMFIADGHHLTPAQLKTMLRAKGLERSLVVSDTVTLGGLPAGKYETPIGGKVELRADGFLAIDDGTGNYLAGAALPMTAAIPVLVNQVGLTLGEAVALLTVAPGGQVAILEAGEPSLVADQHDGAAVCDDVRNLHPLEQRIDGHVDHPGAGAGLLAPAGGGFGGGAAGGPQGRERNRGDEGEQGGQHAGSVGTVTACRKRPR